MRSPLSACGLLAGCLAPFGARAGDVLDIGDPAPPLTVSDWVKGEKVERFEPGKTYVVEFWGTTCGPCIAAMPHLSELAARYRSKDVRFIGVDIWERETKRVKPFVDKMGDKMNFSVALDSVPEKGKSADGIMVKTWMDAAGLDAIPATFIVYDRKIAWIGHPMKLDEPLAKIVAGRWDPSAVRKERLVEKTRELKAGDVREKVYRLLYIDRDYKAVLDTIATATSDDPELVEELALDKMTALCLSGDIKPGLALGAKLFEANRDDAGALYRFSGVIPPGLKNEPDPRVAQLVLKAAHRTVELSKGENWTHLLMLANAQFRTGDAEGAIATQEKALESIVRLSENPELDPRSKAFFSETSKRENERLDQFRQAASAKKDRR